MPYNRLTAASVEVFKISSNRLENFLKPGMFDYFVNLVRLYLADMGIEEIPEEAFQNLANLEWINLNSNNIERFNSNSFGIFTKLESFDLELANVDEIERNFFDNFPALKNIDLTGNECVSKGFSGVKNMLPDFNDCFENWDSPRTTSKVGLNIYAQKARLQTCSTPLHSESS